MLGFYSGGTAVISTRTSDIGANETYQFRASSLRNDAPVLYIFCVTCAKSVAIGRLCEKLDDYACGHCTKGKKGFCKIIFPPLQGRLNEVCDMRVAYVELCEQRGVDISDADAVREDEVVLVATIKLRQAQLTLNRVMATYERAPLVANTPSGRLSRMRISSSSRPRPHYHSGSGRKYNPVVLNTDDGPGAYDSDDSTDPDTEAERVNLIDRFRAAARKPTKVTSASKTKKAVRINDTPSRIPGDNAPLRKSRAPTKKAIIEISSDEQSAVPTSDDDFVRDIPRKSSEKNKRYAITILDPAQGNVSPLSKTAGMFDVQPVTRRLRKHRERSPDATPTTANPALSPETSSGPPTVTAATADPQTATPANTTTTGPAQVPSTPQAATAFAAASAVGAAATMSAARYFGFGL
ncbi:hypothetical protein Tdes44962_MAKER01319 [Teratosphaeria destructans]|uniref:Uncharacterized protein n=1 Tax=Teratosphaeria destructans TaxID=418781 RepID=A0A9W7T104_9PEZI|nr:hypothetical protein Tdes44962_MAKER01319 [Teratosphaeria destructans]